MVVVVVHLPPSSIVAPPSRLLSGNFGGSLFLSNRNEAIALSSFLSMSKLSPISSSKYSCIKEEHTTRDAEGFSVLGSDIPWESETTWSTMALYLFSLHIPMSFGGLSVVAYLLHRPVLDLQTEALSLLAIQTLELTGVLWLLRYIAKPGYKFVNLFQADKLSKDRNWLTASALGFVFLMLLVFITSLLADQLIGPKDVNNPILKEILSSGFDSQTACILVYCFVTPLMEEIVYRGYLLASLTSRMKWQQAVVISAAIFSAAHFSGENFLQLFIIGCVLGSSYCWTGNLSSSYLIHSLYNALTLIITYLS